MSDLAFYGFRATTTDELMKEHNVSEPLEAKFKRQVIKDLNLLENTYWFVKEAKSIRGIPDIICCINGRFVALELKRNRAEGAKNTGRIALQKHNLNRIRECSGEGFIVWPDVWPSTYKQLVWLSKVKFKWE